MPHARFSLTQLGDNIVNDILGCVADAAAAPRRRRSTRSADGCIAGSSTAGLPTMDVSFGWPGLGASVPFLQARGRASAAAIAPIARRPAESPSRTSPAVVRLEEQRRLEHAADRGEPRARGPPREQGLDRMLGTGSST